jgi:hypothetical protein
LDLVRRSQPLGERLQLIAAAGGKKQMATFLGEGLGGGGTYAFDAPVIKTRLPRK